MRRNQSQRQGEGGDGEERGKGKKQNNQPLESKRERAPHPAHTPALRPCGPGLTGPVWGCPRCHTSRTHGSADTRGRSGSGHSSGTEAPSAHCGATGVGRGVRALPPRALPFSL